MKSFMQIILALAILLFSNTIYAQIAPSIEWQKSFGGSSGDNAYSIQQTTDSGFIVVGSSFSTDGDITGNNGSYDYWIVKLDPDGNLVWQKSLGGSNYDLAYSVWQTNDTGFIIAGNSQSNDSNVSGNHGLTDYWIVKLDMDGNVEWQKSLGGSKYDGATSIQETSDGSFIVAGASQSNDGDASGNHGGDDYWIVKLDSDGDIVWEKSLGGSDSDFAKSVQETSDGGFIVGGYSTSYDGEVSGNQGSYDFWIVKLDIQGNLAWQKSLGGSDVDMAYSILQTFDGGFIVGGTSESNDGDISGNHGYADYWIAKLDSEGNLLWQKSLGGSDYDELSFLQQTNDNGFIAVGSSRSVDGDISGNYGSYDFWIVKMESDGNILWEKTFGGGCYDGATSIQQTIDSGFIVAGSSCSNSDDVSGNHGNWDYWIVKLTSDVFNGTGSLSNKFISLNPNPVQSQLLVNLTLPVHERTIIVYDLRGRMIALPITFNNNQAQLNTTTLPKGFYTLQIINNRTRESEVGKFVKAQ